MRLPNLPSLLDRKIYKTGQTRGADDDDIIQNRVGRNSTVLIPYTFWGAPVTIPQGETKFENGFIVLISPEIYFARSEINQELPRQGLKLGENALVFYETRAQWVKNNPSRLDWKPANNRISPLGGNYVARIPATTADEGGNKIVAGFETTSIKGAGIQVYEYASSTTIMSCRIQLETLFWLCYDSEKVVSANGMKVTDAKLRRLELLKKADESSLLDYDKLMRTRVINSKHKTICPLCLEELSGNGFFNRMRQAKGREVGDLTITEINLFHIKELRMGEYNHRPYNLGWGHHHCNVVTKDSGIMKTLLWMQEILRRNKKEGYI
ncbi:MAG TPA: BstXI family restriction endonuclease [Elusimicrobiota bacterium]|nr:BstXI family restriction endonuclease [Elusimicrobiota bacterium]